MAPSPSGRPASLAARLSHMLREPGTVLMMIFTLVAMSVGALIVGGFYLLMRRKK